MRCFRYFFSLLYIFPKPYVCMYYKPYVSEHVYVYAFVFVYMRVCFAWFRDMLTKCFRNWVRWAWFLEGHLCMPCIFAFGVAAGQKSCHALFSIHIRMIYHTCSLHFSIFWFYLMVASLLKIAFRIFIRHKCFFFFSFSVGNCRNKTKSNELEGRWIILRRTDWFDLSILFCTDYYMMSSALCCRFRSPCCRPIEYIRFFLPLFRLFQHLTAFM